MFCVSISTFGGSRGQSLYGKFLSNLLISSRVGFTLVYNKRVKISIIYPRIVDERKFYTRFGVLRQLYERCLNQGY